MAAFLPDARIVDAIIALVAVEGIVLLLWRAITGGGLSVAETLANLSSGAALLSALRMAITGGSSASVLALLSVALIAHVADLASRWNAGSASRPRGAPVTSQTMRSAGSRRPAESYGSSKGSGLLKSGVGNGLTNVGEKNEAHFKGV